MTNFDEMHSPNEASCSHYAAYAQWLAKQSLHVMQSFSQVAEKRFREIGITFLVQDPEKGHYTDRLIPFDWIARIIPHAEWQMLQAGLTQRVTALNHFLHDIYHEQAILKAGIIPYEHVLENAEYRLIAQGLDLPQRIYSQVSGIDIVRADLGQGIQYFVLEDNLRVPSGVSYMLENRSMMQELFPELFVSHTVLPIENYPEQLRQTLIECAHVENPNIAVLTPGPYNSAYFEHRFLAQNMQAALVQGQDLVVQDDSVWRKTNQGLEVIDVIYRRIDDTFLDPKNGHADSLLGCAGLLDVWRKGRVAICNVPGTGVADDKSIYPYVPEMIRFYLSETPILSNVPTYLCRKPDHLAYTLANLKNLVVKETHNAGGYGLFIGPMSTAAEIAEQATKLKANPASYIAQPTLSLSTCPTFVGNGIAPRHIDLRPFVLSGKKVRIVPGGLTRVALKANSLVVNSSQGGGTKDTWVLDNAA